MMVQTYDHAFPLRFEAPTRQETGSTARMFWYNWDEETGKLQEHVEVSGHSPLGWLKTYVCRILFQAPTN